MPYEELYWVIRRLAYKDTFYASMRQIIDGLSHTQLATLKKDVEAHNFKNEMEFIIYIQKVREG